MCSTAIPGAPGLAELTGADPRDLSDSELGERVIELRARIDALEAEWTGLVREADRRRTFEADGAVTMPAWLREHCNLAPGEASGRVRTARRLADLPETTEAFGKGRISYQHVRQIAMLADHTDPEVTRACEPALVTAAVLCDPLTFSRELRAIREAYAPGPSAADEERTYNRQQLSLSPSLDGMYHLSGLLTAESGELVQTALQPLMRPVAPDDKRTPPQRRAEALVEICRRMLDAGELPDNAGVRPHAIVTIDWRWLIDAAGVGVTGWDGTVTAETVRRMLCDASVSRVLLGPDSQPLDVGRASRTATPAQRRALIARDRGCVWPGCRRPPAFCEAHHLIHWVNGGGSSLGNLCLLCRYHHHLLHEGRWQLHRYDDGSWQSVAPSGRRFTRPPPLSQAA